jgi:hypothetical protein
MALSSTSWPVDSVVASAKDWSVRVDPMRSMLELRIPSMASDPPASVSLMRARLSMSLLSSEPARLSKALANSDTRSSKLVERCATVV